MCRRFYYVVADRDEGRLYLSGALIGQHESPDAAIAAAVRLARACGPNGDDADVLVQEDDGRYRVAWASAPGATASGRG